jgi:hypothetical protein
MLDFMKDLPRLAVKYLKSREGKKCLRRCIMPIIVMGSLIMLVVGAIWAKFQYPTCGKSLSSSRFELYTSSKTTRTLSGNSCPGYDWTGQKSTFTAGDHHYEISIPISPKISKNPFYVSEGLIGYALNSVPIFASGVSAKADAAMVQSKKFDQCGGSDSNPVGFTFDLPVTGDFRFFTMPGDSNPMGHSSTLNLNYKLCDASKQWYKESNATSHSPIAGIMADGIPIHGPKGKNGTLPLDLDICGGHSSDLPYYHYHFKSTFPYSVKCLRGCLDGKFADNLVSNCDVNVTATAASNFSSLANLTIKYGGAGSNDTDWSGPACLLIFGFLIFIPGMLCCICMLCGKNISKMHDKKTAGEEGSEEDEDEDDNDNDGGYNDDGYNDDGEEDGDDEYEWVTPEEARRRDAEDRKTRLLR